MRDFPPVLDTFYSRGGGRPSAAPDTRTPMRFLWWTLKLQWPVMRPGINYNATGARGPRGYNGFAFSANTSPAADASITVIYNNADLL